MHVLGCFNKQTWPFDSGKPFTEETMQKLLKEIGDVNCDGLSLSGGDPLNPRNVKTVTEICRRAKELCPNKTIWCWTGYLLDKLTEEQKIILPYLDYVIDGPFVESLHRMDLKWKGSMNQTLWHKKNGEFIKES